MLTKPSHTVLQERLYDFPYHHVPQLLGTNNAVRTRAMAWGFEYLCYLEHLLALVEQIGPSSVLDVGCGDGRFTGALADQGRHVVGVDVSAAAVRFAAAFHPDVQFVTGTTDAVTGQFELVTAVEVIEHIPDHGVSTFLRGLAKRVAAGGQVIITAPTTVVPLNAKHHRHYDAQKLTGHFAAAGIPVEVGRLEYVCHHSRLLTFYNRATINRLWTVDIAALNNVMWRYTWHRLRFAHAGTGRHIVAVLRLL